MTTVAMDADRNPEAWRAARAACLTGHDAAALAGVNPYRSPLAVWAEKTGRAEAPDIDTPATRRGRILEPAILAEVERELGRALERPGFRRDPEVPFFGGTPDAWDPVTKTLYEVKTVGPRAEHKWGEGDDVEPAAWVQAHWYAGILGAERIVVLAYFTTSDELRRYEMPVDRETVAGLRAHAEAWWVEHVVGDVRPVPGEGEVASWAALDEVLDRLHMRDNGKAIEADPDMTAAVLAYDEARRAQKAAEEAKSAAAAQIKAQMGDAAKARGAGFSVAWTNRKESEATDWQALARACWEILDGAATAMELNGIPRQQPFPAGWVELVSQYTTTKPGVRVLRVTLAKESA